MANRVLCGFHALQSIEGSDYYPVLVYYKLDDNLSFRETGLAVNERCETLEEALDVLDDLSYCMNYDCSESEEDFDPLNLRSNVELDALTVKFPGRSEIGNIMKGKVVGWHIDFKTNANKKHATPCLITNIAWMSDDGGVGFVVVDKMSIKSSGPAGTRAGIHKLFRLVTSRYKLGGELELQVVPVGKSLARYTLTEYTNPVRKQWHDH